MSLVSKLKVQESIVEVEYPSIEGFVVQICYLSKEKSQKIIERHRVQKLNRKTRQMETDVDQEKFLEDYSKNIIRGWSGLRIRDLPKLLPVDLSDLDNIDEEVPYTQEDALELLKNSSDFDQFITESLQDLEKFTIQKKEEEEKN